MIPCYSGVYGHYHTMRDRRLLDEYDLRVVTEATDEPVTLEEARSHLRIDAFGSPLEHPDDTQITSIYLPSAREFCETEAGVLLATQTVEYALDGFPARARRFWLPMGPVQSVESVVYLDVDGAEQTMTLTTDYLTRLYGGRASVYLPDDVAWPTTAAYSRGERAVFVRYVAGHTSGSPDLYPLPRSAKNAILLVLGHLYENREDAADKPLEELPLAARHLLVRIRQRFGWA